MTGNTQHIIRQLFQAGSLENVSLQQLEELVEAYPSFSVGHYLLSKKLQQEDNYAFAQQTRKTALYFTNPFWLQWLFQHADNKKQVVRPEPVLAIEKYDAEPVFENVTEKHAPDAMNEAISKSASQQQSENAHGNVKEEAPVFEAYHTIDYFASQGIKFVQEANPNDRLGRQLKSFTEWLRIMKKLPQKADAPGDEAVEATIEMDAAHSIEEKEVVTEAMAEVLMKQGKSAKAAEVYRKLSLLYPEKSAYFATKIDQIKVN